MSTNDLADEEVLICRGCGEPFVLGYVMEPRLARCEYCLIESAILADDDTKKKVRLATVIRFPTQS